MSKKLIPVVVLVIVAVIVVLLVGKKSPTSTDMPIDTTVDSENATTTPAKSTVKRSKSVTSTIETPVENTVEETAEVEETPTKVMPANVSWTVRVNDEKTDTSVIEVNEGDTVRLTIIADPRNNYHNGLEFRSEVLDPIRVLNGQSMMISFEAEESFTLTPYWPGFNTNLPYKIDVVVK